MTNKVLLVTSPDDVQENGIRILTVDLEHDQNQIVSNAVNSVDHSFPVIFYVWRSEDPVEWFLDKKLKSSLIIFNANSGNDMINGFLSADLRSHYFGTLKSLHIANKNAIYTVDDCITLLNDKMTRYER